MYLVLVAPQDDGMVMYQLHYADEVQSIADVPKGDAEPKEAELALAMQLIEQISSDHFQPEKYEDEVKRRMEAAIQRKIEGQDITEPAEEQPKAQIIDIMAALKASLGASDTEAEADAEVAERAPAKEATKRKRGASVTPKKKVSESS